MHDFPELIQRCTVLTLGALNADKKRLLEELQSSGATSLVKALQMGQVQRAIHAIGMFSMFEAVLQSGLGTTQAFQAAGAILVREGEESLNEIFVDLQLAINVLKHGKGRSYDKLLAKGESLPFRVKQRGESFFSEGDVSEIATLIEVDDTFVELCAKVVGEVSAAVQKAG